MRPFSKNAFVQPAGLATVETCLPSSSLSQIFVMTDDGYVMTDESVYLDAPDRNTKTIRPRVKTMACNELFRQKWRYDENVRFF